MTLGLPPLTELEAVNEMLGTGSESPVSTLDTDEVIDAALARDLLRTTSKEVQTRGWWFNTSYGSTLTRDQSNRINLPTNVLKIKPSGNSLGLSAVQRGVKLYNVLGRTDEFTSDVTVDMTLGLDFEDLPSSARLYITIRAARKYQDRYSGDDALHQYTKQDETMAWGWLIDEEIEVEAPNMLNGPFEQNLMRRE